MTSLVCIAPTSSNSRIFDYGVYSRPEVSRQCQAACGLHANMHARHHAAPCSEPEWLLPQHVAADDWGWHYHVFPTSCVARNLTFPILHLVQTCASSKFPTASSFLCPHLTAGECLASCEGVCAYACA